ncbi:hypothetical protein [Neobacillus sp. FSL H8-0543]|uniref:hypothetical protein n=1 Tax=Neobacillus sp. FSL H8-0543 TaxID=2954672 RepID=UPI00315981BD
MATGKDIKEIYDMMKTVCQETSKLMIVINDMMESEGFKAVSGGSVMWDRSSHFRSPDYWLPYFLQRVFAKGGNLNKGIGINVIFDGSMHGIENTIPFLTCGLLESEKDKLNKSNELYVAGWRDDEEVVKTEDGKLCVTNFSETGISTTTYYLPIDILNDQDKVHKYIIKPLINLYRGQFDDAKNMISDVAIGLEEIVGQGD